MFYSSYHHLKTPLPDGFEKNCLIEVFVVHARCLTDFLYPPANAQEDDVLSTDFFEDATDFITKRPNMNKLIQLSKVRANKEVAHITYKRLGLTPQQKNWDIDSIEKELRATLKIFLDSLPEEKRGWFPTIT